VDIQYSVYIQYKFADLVCLPIDPLVKSDHQQKDWFGTGIDQCYCFAFHGDA
jgi:hypothetical protein